MNIQSAPLPKRHFVGLALTHAAGKPLSCRVILDRLDARQPRRALLKSCGMVPLHDASVPRFVQQALRPDTMRGPTLQLPDLDQLIGSSFVQPG